MQKCISLVLICIFHVSVIKHVFLAVTHLYFLLWTACPCSLPPYLLGCSFFILRKIALFMSCFKNISPSLLINLCVCINYNFSLPKLLLVSCLERSFHLQDYLLNHLKYFYGFISYWKPLIQPELILLQGNGIQVNFCQNG